MTALHVGQALTRLLSTAAATAIWEPHAVRRSPVKPHRRAVAAAVAARVFDDSERGAEIKDRIADALDGTRVSAETVDHLADTFAFPTATRELLHRLRTAEDGESERLLATLPSGSDAARAHRTVQLHEVHELGANGWPVRHTTVQTIQAVRNGVRTIEYSFVTGDGAATVEVSSGGTALSTRPSERPGLTGLLTTTIELSKVLAASEPHELTFVTTFSYRSQPEQVFRRGLSSQVEVVAVKVVFDPARLPRFLWETEWAGDDGREVVMRERRHVGTPEPSVELIRRHSTARWVGYQWEW